MSFKKSFGPALDAFKSMYQPVKDENLRMVWGGAIAVPNKNNSGQYLAFDPTTDQLIAYPAAMTMNFPVYFLSKAINQIVKGDVVKQGNTYYRVRCIKDDKLYTDSFYGCTRTILPIKDFIIGQTLIPVAINMFGCFGNGTVNPANIVSNNPFANMFGGNSMMGMFMMSKMFKDDSSDEEVVDEFTDMDRRELKLYQQHNSLGVKVFPSMSDEDLRNAIRRKLNRKTSDEGSMGDMMQTMMLSNMMSGQTTGGMNPIAMMMFMNDGDNNDNLMMLLAMQQLQTQAVTTPINNTPQPEVVGTAPASDTVEDIANDVTND